jgi:hypothetical protein
MEVVPLIKPQSGADYHRLSLPFQYLGADLDILNTETVANLFSKAKVVVYNRTPGFDINYLLAFRKKYGFKVVIDLDDYWMLSSKSIHYASWKKQNTTQIVLEGLMNADFVTVTNARLAEQALKYNRNVEVVPNALPYGEGQFADTRYESEITRIMYAGGGVDGQLPLRMV